jgi:hypothetical protein
MNRLITIEESTTILYTWVMVTLEIRSLFGACSAHEEIWETIGGTGQLVWLWSPLSTNLEHEPGLELLLSYLPRKEATGQTAGLDRLMLSTTKRFLITRTLELALISGPDPSPCQHFTPTSFFLTE